MSGNLFVCVVDLARERREVDSKCEAGHGRLRNAQGWASVRGNRSDGVGTHRGCPFLMCRYRPPAAVNVLRVGQVAESPCRPLVSVAVVLREASQGALLGG